MPVQVEGWDWSPSPVSRTPPVVHPIATNTTAEAEEPDLNRWTDAEGNLDWDAYADEGRRTAVPETLAGIFTGILAESGYTNPDLVTRLVRTAYAHIRKHGAGIPAPRPIGPNSLT